MSGPDGGSGRDRRRGGLPGRPEAPHIGGMDRWKTLNARLKRMLVRIRQRVPPGARTLLGLCLVAGGIVGFLPVLGFWMIPLGVLVIGLDVKPVLAWLRGRRAKGKRG